MLVEWGQVDWYEYLSRFGIIEQKKKGRRKEQTGKHELMNVYTAFDIETSTIWLNPDHSEYDVHSFMYIWQFQIEEYTVIGRTWEEYLSFLQVLRLALDRIKGEKNLSLPPLLIIWVHNLAYEFSFLSGIYPFTDDECFFRDVRRPIYCRMYECFEYRCSYIQSNLSLEALCKETGVKEKLSGDKFNYDKVRFPWTELSPYEMEYCITDVQSLVQAMKVRVQRSGDNLLTVPLTSTGYVRRDCKNALNDNFLDMRDLKPDEEEYRLLRDAFRGGNTHANRYHVGHIIKDVYSYDICSSYPTQQLTKKFPIKPFKWLDFDGYTSSRKMDRVMTFIGLGYAVVGRYQFKDVKLRRDWEPVPYISLARCEALDFKVDNGRILSASYIEISLTEIDLKIILDQYEFSSIDIVKAMVAQKGYLPAPYRAVIQDYYNKKTALKGDDSEEGKYIYTKSKNMLNSVYGMSATDPIHQEIKYNGGDYIRSSYDTMTHEEIQKALKRSAMPYQWGCYTTAYAREQLQLAIRFCDKYGKDKLVYCDTDSIKTVGPVDIEQLNDKLQDVAIQQGAYADDMHGTRHYIGIFESDGHYDEFITLGAKRYAYKENGKLGVTVAGVSKKINKETGVTYAVEELKTLKRFKVGMKWEKAGGTIAVYNDADNLDYTDPESGRTIHISKNVSIVPSTYVLTHTRDYMALLNEIQLYREFKKERE